jgi:hypothetical protein
MCANKERKKNNVVLQEVSLWSVCYAMLRAVAHQTPIVSGARCTQSGSVDCVT